MLWWLNITCKWQNVCLRLFQRRPSLSKQDLDRVVHFFKDTRFEQWAFVPENHRAKMTDHTKFSSYKDPLKQYILDFTHDREYFEHKLKEGSLCKVNDSSHFVIMGVDANLNVIRFGSHCLNLAAMERAYPNGMLRTAFLRENSSSFRRFQKITSQKRLSLIKL